MSDQENSSGDGPGRSDDPWTTISYLLGGMAVWGGIGWAVDRWLGFSALFLPIGLIIGLAAAMYLIYIRLGRS